MIRSRLGLKTLILSALVLGLMAFVTSGVAHATPGAKWTYLKVLTVEGKEVIDLLTFDKNLLPVIGASLDSPSASLDFTTGGGTKVSFTCTVFKLEGEPKLLENGSVSDGKATFTGCETFLNGVVSKACLPKTNGGPTDQIQTNVAHALLELHKLADGKLHHVVKILPLKTNAKGELLAATLELGEECSIGTKVEIIGSLDIWDCPASGITGLTHAEKHLIEEFPALRLLKALGQPATVLGSAFVFLLGAHEKLKWAGLTA